jgi:hypothetical protein
LIDTHNQQAERHRFVWRLLAAQTLLKAGFSRAQVRRLASGNLIERLFKYSPDQPREPAGSGRISGQWTTGGAGQAAGSAQGSQPNSRHLTTPRRGGPATPKTTPPRATIPTQRLKSPAPTRAAVATAGAAAATAADALGPRNPGIDIGGLSDWALSGLATFLRGLAVAPEAFAGAAVGGFGLSFIPTNGPLGGWTKLPGPGDVSVFQHLDEPGLTFRYTTADGVQHEWMAAPAAPGVYLGPDGKVIARWTKVAGALGLVVSTAALLNDEQPKLCPTKVTDAHGPNGLAYEEYMKRLFNPGNPTPKDMAYGFYGPDGRLVRIDDCQQQTGIVAEYKGPGYAYHLAKGDYVWRGQLEQMLDQAERQTKAAPASG